jgi:predicted esterase
MASMNRRTALFIAVLAVTGIGAAPQVERYDLGQRLRKMEQAWEAATAENRAKAVVPLKTAVPLFFANKNPEAAQVLDESRFVLEGRSELTPGERWANALLLRPAARLVDPADGPLPIRVAPCYRTSEKAPANVRLSFSTEGPNCRIELGDFDVGALPTEGIIEVAKLPSGDHVIRARASVEGKPIAQYGFGLSVAQDWKRRLESVRKAIEQYSNGESRPGNDCGSGRALIDTIDRLVQGELPETDYPAARLLGEVECIVRSAATNCRFYGPQRPGQFWLNLPQRHAEVRLFVPEGLQKDRPVPLVIAMHGAGGSENMFFDTYGDGATLRMCQKRGWLLVGTRAGGLFDGAPPVERIVDELAERFPIDRSRVYLMGHSMGATHVLDVVQASPGKFAAVVALGGGGRVRDPASVKGVPIFVACGSEDFALSAAKVLARILEKAEARVTFKEYPAIEHVVIVQAAIHDVFAFFESAERKGK